MTTSSFAIFETTADGSSKSKVKQAIRRAVRKFLEASREYDASTMRIGRDGTVTARKSADKLGGGHDPVRYLIGHIDDIQIEEVA